MPERKLIPLNRATKIANLWVERLTPACERIEIAGSIRRKRPEVHDIDLVLQPIMEQAGQMPLFGGDAFLWPVRLQKIMSGYMDATFKEGYPRRLTLDDDIPIEIYLTEPYYDNYYALLQMRTGSAKFNISVSIKAQKMGLTYRAGHGIYDRLGERIDDKTEEGIFRAIGVEYVQPEKREQAYWDTTWSR